MSGRTMIGLLLVLSLLGSVAQAQLITAVAHRNTDTDAPEAPQIASPLQEDALVFVDRVHIYKVVPEFLIGAEYVMAANDNKNMSAYELDITLSRPATVYVFVDNRMGGAAGGLNVAPNITGMPWLTDMGFVDTGEDIGIDESADGSINQYFSIFALEVKAGTVTVGGCTEGHGGNMLGYAALPRAGGDKAQNPVPEDGATDVPRDIALAWTAGEFAAVHNVYLGTDFAEVNNATAGSAISTGQAEATYEPASALAYGQTFYWRIDEVNAPPDATVFKGDTWSFTVEPYAYPVQPVAATASSVQEGMGPENTINGSGLDADGRHGTEPKEMWLSAGVQPNWIQYEFDQPYKLYELHVWNSNQLIESFIGFGAKGVTIEASLDGETWTALEGVPEFARATGMPGYEHNTTVDLGGVVAKYVRLTINSGWGSLPQAGLAEVRFFSVPVYARQPEPAAGAANVALNPALNWRPGREAASHVVYFSADADAVANGTAPSKTVTDHSFLPATLDLDTAYAWRVDEVNEAMDPSVYQGAVWTFTTQAFAVVDDMESYNDDDNRIYDAWIDGLTDAAKGGSQVGYDVSPFAEKDIVHGGGQSMPLIYSNTGSALSEATITFAAPQNWTASGIKSLSLYFQGEPDNTGTLYLKINNTKVAYSGAASDISKAAWTPWNVDLSTIGGNVSNVTKLTIGVEGTGAQGTLYIDDIRLYPRAPEFVTPVQPDNANLAALYAFEGNTNDTSGKGLNGTIKQGTLVASDSPTGGSVLQVMKAGYVDLGNRPSLDFSTTDWTVTAWFKTSMTGTGDANKGTIYSKGGDSTGGHRYAIIMSETTEGVVTLVTDDDATKYVVDSKSVVNDGRWHFVAAQREGTALRIYIDGQLEGSATVPATYSLAGTSQHNAYIGTVTNHADGTLYKLYDGQIDDVRVYSRALTEGEILWLAGKTLPVVKPF